MDDLSKLERAVGFDPDFLCVYCEEPVTALSMGGPMMCPWCDCGANSDGTQWTHAQATERYANARRRFALLGIGTERKA